MKHANNHSIEVDNNSTLFRFLFQHFAFHVVTKFTKLLEEITLKFFFFFLFRFAACGEGQSGLGSSRTSKELIQVT